MSPPGQKVTITGAAQRIGGGLVAAPANTATRTSAMLERSANPTTRRYSFLNETAD
jgi:hypothetical protein